MTIQISNSKLSTFRRCPHKYYYKYALKLRPKKRQVQLERGSWIHELLMVHADGEDWRVRHATLTQQFNNLWEEEREDLGDLPRECARIMRSYLRTYKDDKERYRVIDTELDEVVTLPNGVKLQVIIDIIVEDLIDGGLWIKDYKTRAKFADADSQMLDPQLTLYFKAVEMLGYAPLRGGMYDEIRTKAPTVPRVLKSGRFSKEKKIDTDVYTYMSAIRKRNFNPADYSDILMHIARNQKGRFFRRTMLPKDPPLVRTTVREAMQTASFIAAAERKGYFPRTFDGSCKWQCEYKDLCIVELHGGNIEPMVKMNFEQRGRHGSS